MKVSVLSMFVVVGKVFISKFSVVVVVSMLILVVSTFVSTVFKAFKSKFSVVVWVSIWEVSKLVVSTFVVVSRFVKLKFSVVVVVVVSIIGSEVW